MRQAAGQQEDLNLVKLEWQREHKVLEKQADFAFSGACTHGIQGWDWILVTEFHLQLVEET